MQIIKASKHVVGVDEVGRGCWAGPLVAAAVMLDDERSIIGIKDSKKLSNAQRERLDTTIREQALAIGIGWVWPAEIDIIGLTAAVRSAMQQAVDQIQQSYDVVIIDGSYNFLPENVLVRTMVRADALVPAVSAASIIAKVARDSYMTDWAAHTYPLYGFDRHVGYGTALHISALQQYGVTDIHRMSYKPIRRLSLRNKT
jgi:ribonuclease HII